MSEFAGLNFMLAAAGVGTFEDRRARACEQLAEPAGWACVLAETLSLTHSIRSPLWHDMGTFHKFGWDKVTHDPRIEPETGLYAAWFRFTPKAEGGFRISAHSHGTFHILKETMLDVGILADGRLSFTTRDQNDVIVESHTLPCGDDVLAQCGAWLARNFTEAARAEIGAQAPKIAAMKAFQMPVPQSDFFSRYHPAQPKSPARTDRPAQLTAA